MSYIIKKQKIWIALTLVTVSVLVGMMTFSSSLVTAQEPEDNKPGTSEGFSPEALAPFAPYYQNAQVEKAPANLRVVKTTTTPSVTSGNNAIFVITIKNEGPNPANLVHFYDDYPTQMSQVTYQFSGGNPISNGLSKPTWLLQNPINSGLTVVVTVTGRLNSIPTVNVTNVAEAYSFVRGDDSTPADNKSSATVALTGSNPGAFTGPIFFPRLIKSPQPTLFLAYHEDFGSNDAWSEGSGGGCALDNEGGRYIVEVDGGDRSCLPFADNNDRKPERPYREHGEFEVEAQRRSGGDDDFSYGIFINGDGPNNYYLFRVWPNNNCSSGGNWLLMRRRDGNNTNLASGNCNIHIRRGSSVNTLRIAHNNAHQLILSVNGQTLYTFTDTSNHLDGETIGIYAHSEEDDVTIGFDNFKVYRYP